MLGDNIAWKRFSISDRCTSASWTTRCFKLGSVVDIEPSRSLNALVLMDCRVIDSFSMHGADDRKAVTPLMGNEALNVNVHSESVVAQSDCGTQLMHLSDIKCGKDQLLLNRQPPMRHLSQSMVISFSETRLMLGTDDMKSCNSDWEMLKSVRLDHLAQSWTIVCSRSKMPWRSPILNLARNPSIPLRLATASMIYEGEWSVSVCWAHSRGDERTSCLNLLETCRKWRRQSRSGSEYSKIRRSSSFGRSEMHHLGMRAQKLDMRFSNEDFRKERTSCSFSACFSLALAKDIDAVLSLIDTVCSSINLLEYTK